MTARVVTLGVLLMLVALTGGMTAAQAPRGQIEELVVLNNDSVRIVLMTYPPGADSDLHLQAGAAHWLPDGTAHLARNEGNRPVRFWSLLLKRCD